jgi:hypothetical protein
MPLRFEEAKVLDISQTDGEPFPRIAGDVMTDNSVREAFIDTLKKLYPSHIGEKINIQKFSGIIQSILNEDEFSAKSVAYVVCNRFGISGADAPQTEIHDKKIFPDTLEKIRSNADRIITAIETKFMQVCQERGINPMILPKITEPEISQKIAPQTSSYGETKFVLAQPPPIQSQSLKYMPDMKISVKDRSHYGYTRPELLPLTRVRAEALFLRDMNIYLLYKNNTEKMAFYLSDIQTHDGIFGVPHSQWQNSREYIALASGDPDAIAEAEFIYGAGDSFAVFQLKNDKSIEPFREKTYEHLMAEALSINRNNYRIVFSTPLPHTPSNTPEGIFMWFNAEKPEGYTGRDINVSDILSIYKWGKISSFYINGRSYRELLDFLGIENKKHIHFQKNASGNNASTSTSDSNTQNKSSPPRTPTIPKMEVPQIPKEVDVFPLTAIEAEEYGRMEEYALSLATNIQCCEVIDQAIRESEINKNEFDLLTSAENLVMKYGHSRMVWVLGIFILQNQNSFSKNSIAWAKKVLSACGYDDNGNPQIPNEPPTFTLKTNTAILETFIKRLQEVFDRKSPFKERMAKAKKKSQARSNAENKS